MLFKEETFCTCAGLCLVSCFVLFCLGFVSGSNDGGGTDPSKINVFSQHIALLLVAPQDFTAFFFHIQWFNDTFLQFCITVL